ncbi:MAG: helix-turn-helix domain-containing protein [Proteobacteria bacterium]|nr:helix-turn-helix domain-containing protein [Pseudomonadota bacterium]
MINNVRDNDIDKLYDLFEVKLEFIADNLLLSKTNNNDNVLMNVQAVIEKVFIISAMKISNNNISKASKLLGINRNTLSKKLKELKAATDI